MVEMLVDNEHVIFAFEESSAESLESLTADLNLLFVSNSLKGMFALRSE